MLALLTLKAADSREMFVVRMLRDPPTPCTLRARSGGGSEAAMWRTCDRARSTSN